MTPSTTPTLDPRAPSSIPRSTGEAVADGVWWPNSRDAGAELPGLITAVDERMGRATMRVSLYADAWDDIPQRIPARGRQVRVGWFRHSDPRMVTLTLDGFEQVSLLVVPPGAETEADRRGPGRPRRRAHGSTPPCRLPAGLSGPFYRPSWRRADLRPAGNHPSSISPQGSYVMTVMETIGADRPAPVRGHRHLHHRRPAPAASSAPSTAAPALSCWTCRR